MPKLIAIIDDEPEMEYLFDMLFEKSIKNDLINVKYFTDSREFLSWFKTNRPDLIMSDINMPHLDSIELGQHIHDSGRSVTTYFVSGYDESDYTRVMEELGIRRFLSKPLNFEKVAELIETDLKLPLQ